MNNRYWVDCKSIKTGERGIFCCDAENKADAHAQAAKAFDNDLIIYGSEIATDKMQTHYIMHGGRFLTVNGQTKGGSK